MLSSKIIFLSYVRYHFHRFWGLGHGQVYSDYHNVLSINYMKMNILIP